MTQRMPAWLTEALDSAPKLNNPLLPGYDFHNVARRTKSRKAQPIVPVARVLGSGTVGLGPAAAADDAARYQAHARETWEELRAETIKEQRLRQARHEHLILEEMKTRPSSERQQALEAQAALNREARLAREQARRQEAVEECSLKARRVAEVRATNEEYRAQVCADLDRRDLLNAIRYAKERAYAGVVSLSRGASSSPSPSTLSRPSTATPGSVSGSSSRARLDAVQARAQALQERAVSASSMRAKLRRLQQDAQRLREANEKSIKSQCDELRQERGAQRREFLAQREKLMDKRREEIEREALALKELADTRQQALDDELSCRAQFISETRRRISMRSPSVTSGATAA